MSSSSVARSEKILDRLAREEHLTEAAKQWLTVTLDPFHDTPTNCTGIPDSQTGDSVVQCIKSSVTIAKPSGITTGTWDCHVVMSPFFANSASPLQFVSGFSEANNAQPLWYDYNQVDRGTGPITIASYATGNNSGFPNPFAGGNPTNTVQNQTILNLNGNYTNGDYRVVSQGFEVVNTTAVLNQQGLCTVYRSPVPSIEDATIKQTVELDGGSIDKELRVTGAVQYLPIQNVPVSPAQALTLPGTKQWHAKEGCYVVARLNDCDTATMNNSWLQPLIDRGNPDSASGVSYYFPRLGTTTFGTTTPVKLANVRPIQWSNMDISGAFFTGLSLETTLTFNWNIYIERFPAISEYDLVVIAKPSPSYCPMAFEVYKAVAQNLPVGCMQKENGLGDWFRDAVGTVAEFVQPIAAMIPHPAAQVVSKVAGVANNLARRDNESPYIGSAKQEKLYLEPPREPMIKKKKLAKEVKKDVKRDIKKAVMPQRKKAGRK